MSVFEKFASHVNTESVLLDKLVFLLREQGNITDEFLLWTIKYCVEHKIPIFEDKRFQNLMSDSKQIIQEIKKTSDTLGEVCKNFHQTDFDRDNNRHRLDRTQNR